MERQHRDRQSVHKDGLSLQQTETLRNKHVQDALVFAVFVLLFTNIEALKFGFLRIRIAVLNNGMPTGLTVNLLTNL